MVVQWVVDWWVADLGGSMSCWLMDEANVRKYWQILANIGTIISTIISTTISTMISTIISTDIAPHLEHILPQACVHEDRVLADAGRQELLIRCVC